VACSLLVVATVHVSPSHVCLCSVSDLTASLVGRSVLVRARIHTTRETGKVFFVTLRQGIATVQGVALKAANADLLKFLSSLPRETVVDVTGTVTKTDVPVVSTTQPDVELGVETVFVVSRASPVLPFSLEDAARSDAVVEAREKEIAEAEKAGVEAPPGFPLVNPVSQTPVSLCEWCVPLLAPVRVMRAVAGACARGACRG